jgi:hypothetical protein
MLHKIGPLMGKSSACRDHAVATCSRRGVYIRSAIHCCLVVSATLPRHVQPWTSPLGNLAGWLAQCIHECVGNVNLDVLFRSSNGRDCYLTACALK